MFLEISQNSQENTFELCEISKNTFSTEHPQTTASVPFEMKIKNSSKRKINCLKRFPETVKKELLPRYI